MKLNSVDFNKIAIFCQIVEAGNYRRASEVLNVTPSALCQTITSLEHSLGVALFDRRGRRLVPTERGLRIHREFAQAQSGFLQTLRDMKIRQAEVSGTLRVGAYLEFAKSRLTPMMKEFIRDFPAANLKMAFDSPSRLQQLLDRGDLDLCLSIFPASQKKRIRSSILCEEELVLIAQAGSRTIEQILSQPIIDYYFNHQLIARWMRLHFPKHPKKIPVRIFAATAEMVVALVNDGAGIGVVPAYLVSGMEAQKNLRIIRPTPKRLTDYVWLLERVQQDRSGVHTAFRTNLLRHFNRTE